MSNLPEMMNPSGDEDGDVVTPWSVTTKSQTGIDYDKLINKFGSQRISDELLAEFETITGEKAHHFLRRGIFFSHRDLEQILKLYQDKKPFYIYTGRGPSSSSMHIGHMIPFIFTVWLQKTFDCPVIIQLTDDEKWACNHEKVSREECEGYSFENAKDIIACGFDVKKTLIFSNLAVLSHKYTILPEFSPMSDAIGHKTSNSKVRAVFGFEDKDNITKNYFPARQAAPAFSTIFNHVFGVEKPIPCLIPCGIDQDPYFRVTRDVSQKFNHPKPALIHSKFFPALQGLQKKMSSSDETSAIFLTDTKKQVANKIKKYAFSGGGDTIEEHRAKGGNCDVDIAFQYLIYLLDDDVKIEELRQAYSSGDLLTGQLKEEAIKLLQELVEKHQSRRAQVTDEVVMKFMKADRFPRSC